MSLTLAIVLNVLADLAILGMLAFVTSRAAKLTPHAAAPATPSARPVRVTGRRRAAAGHAPALATQS